MKNSLALLAGLIGGCGGRASPGTSDAAADAGPPDGFFVHACSSSPAAGSCTPFVRDAPVPLDGPLVALDTGWGAISNHTTYVQLSSAGDVVAMATLPAATSDPGQTLGAKAVQKHALVWNGAQVAIYLTDRRVAIFAPDGSNLREGPVVGDDPDGALRVTPTGYELSPSSFGSEGFPHCELDASGAVVGAPCTPPLPGKVDPQIPVALTQLGTTSVLVSLEWCGGPGRTGFCPGFRGVGNGFPPGNVALSEKSAIDADTDGTTLVTVAYGEEQSFLIGPPRSPLPFPIQLHGAWTTSGGDPAPVSWSTSTPLGVSWTGGFWETLALTDHGTLAAERLAAGLQQTSACDITNDTQLVRPPVVVARADRALIVLPYADATKLVQLCF